MKFRTSISLKQASLIGDSSFVQSIFLLLRGKKATKAEGALLDATFVACLDNGIEAPSIYIPRVVLSTGNSMNAALAAGVLSIGDAHGGAAEKATEVFSSKESPEKIVRSYASLKKNIPGFGHKIYKNADPRVVEIFKIAKKSGLIKYFNKAYKIEKELAKAKGKKIPLNIDGALACVMLELGFDPKLGKAFFIIPRMVGMAAHLLEEDRQNNSYYRLEESDVDRVR
jgi:citryl-CoA lyase